MINRFWQPFDTENLIAIAGIICVGLILLVIWLAGINSRGTKQ
jgi:hypothetical protein